ncbi:RHS repeat-associated core domain-containing protein, partial [Aquimarina spongiae]
GRKLTDGQYRYQYQGQEKDTETDKEAFELRLWDARIARWLTTDPKNEFASPYLGMANNPINKIDPDGGSTNDWVKREDGSIYWDPNANSQATTKAGETYLGKTVTFTFNSFIDEKYWDGPGGGKPLIGDKITSTVTISGIENQVGDLLSIASYSSYRLGPTPVGKGRNYYPGEGGRNNIFLQSQAFEDGKFIGYDITFEQHASVPKIEEFALSVMGYRIVDVSQKLNISIHNGELSFSAYTNIFPSATLDVNDIRYMHYIQPSFEKTHRADLFYRNRNTKYFPSKFFQRY